MLEHGDDAGGSRLIGRAQRDGLDLGHSAVELIGERALARLIVVVKRSERRPAVGREDGAPDLLKTQAAHADVVAARIDQRAAVGRIRPALELELAG